MNSGNSIIYVLTNDAMPGLIKIGRTSGESVERRVAELSRATGVPLPFKVACCATNWIGAPVNQDRNR